MATPPVQQQFGPPPRLSGEPARDQAALVEYLWALHNAAFTNNGLVQANSLNAELLDQFPILYAIGTVTGAGADKMLYFTASEAVAVTALTDDARLLLSKDSVDDMVTFLGVSTLTTEQVQDLVDTMIQDGTGITWTYDDGAGTLTGNVTITQYTDELAQDAVGGILVDSTTINFTYTDATPSITAIVIDGSISTAKLGDDITSAGKALLDDANAAAQRVTLDVQRTLFTYVSDVGNVGTGEDTLYSDDIDAGQLSGTGDRIEAHYAGIFVSSATATRRLRVYFGGASGTLIYDSTALSLSVSADWDVSVSVIRQSSTQVKCSVRVNTTGASSAPYCTYTRITGLTLSDTQIIKITGEAAGVGAATDDIVAKFGSVDFCPAS